MSVYRSESNVNHKYRSLTAVRGKRLSAGQQASLDADIARQKEGKQRVIDATNEEHQLFKETCQYILHIKHARAKGRKPRLARKAVRENLRNLQRIGNIGRNNPRKKK